MDQQLRQTAVEGISRLALMANMIDMDDTAHDSPEVLDETVEAEEVNAEPTPQQQEDVVTASPYRTRRVAIEMVAIDEIRHFTVVPDFSDPMDSERPYLIRTPEGVFCLDGFNMVEQVGSSGSTELECEVEEIESHSDTELCLRKMASRSRTRGGKVIYAEEIRNTRNACELLLVMDGDIRLLGHGGRRMGTGFSDDRENNARQILATRLGKDRDTINTHLSHAGYLSPEAFLVLVAERLPREFFSMFSRRVKRSLTAKLQKENADSIRIMQEISEAAVNFVSVFKEEREAKKAHRNHRQGEPEEVLTAEVSPPETSEVSMIEEALDGDGESSETIEEPEEESSESISLPRIKRSVHTVASRIQAVVSDDVDVGEIVKCLRREMAVLQMLLNSLNALQESGVESTS